MDRAPRHRVDLVGKSELRPDHQVVGCQSECLVFAGNLDGNSERPGRIGNGCRASDLSVVSAVELNDSPHSVKRAQARDELLGNVCEATWLPVFRVLAKRSNSAH